MGCIISGGATVSKGEIHVECADLRLLWEYSTWANGQILAAACRLPPAALREPLASGHGTLFSTLLHILDTEYGWRMLGLPYSSG
jgi:uncharacterized damage-inducible protein DinB